MPRKIKIVNESIEKSPPSSPVNTPDVVEVVEDTPNPIVEEKPPKEKKPRTEKQILAFQKALEKRKEKLAEKKSLEEKVVVEEKEVKEVKKRGRPALSQEKIEMKASLKEIELQKQVEKLQKKIEKSAKKEAKKVVLDKIKSKLNTDEDSEVSLSDDEEISELIKKQKKPIVILNKIDNGKAKKAPQQNYPTAVFI